jgi:hypothetical protein
MEIKAQRCRVGLARSASAAAEDEMLTRGHLVVSEALRGSS